MKRPLEKLTKEEFEGLKALGMLWEFYPNAPDIYEKIHNKESKVNPYFSMDWGHWCMCTQIDLVARDGRSTCGNCGGKDAYGRSTERPEKFKKTIRTR